MNAVQRVRVVACRGFTLVETLMVMVVLGIAASTVISLQGNIFLGQSANMDMQVGVQLMQRCAEQVLGIRRHWPISGYPLVTTTVCNGLGTYGGFGTPVLTLRDDSGASVSACASTTCTVSIRVGKDGSNLAPISLRLTKY